MTPAHQCTNSGEALVSGLRGKPQRVSKGGHSRRTTVAEEFANANGAVGFNSFGEVDRAGTRGIGDLQAPPHITDVGVPVPDLRREALQHKCANLIGKEQPDLVGITVEPAKVQR
jgi:hypothetical protein